MKILVTGAKGQLGVDLVRILEKQHHVYAFGKQELDVTNHTKVLKVVSDLYPDAIIHTAAYTQVDQAEHDPESAFFINAYGTRNIAVAARQVGAKIIYVSTDYVFDGNNQTPYREFDQVNPINVYGKSKLAGEELVKSLSDKYFIVRTSWVFGKHGKNFVKTMIRLAQERKELSVVNDQIGSPTYTVDLAEFLKALVSTEKYGIYHASNAGSCSWYEFANAIFQEMNIPIHVKPIPTEEYPLPAARPRYSVLDHMAIKLNGFSPFRHWKGGLWEFLLDHKTET